MVAAGGDPDLERFLQQISLRKQPLAAHLAEADRLEFSDHLVKIYAPLQDPWLTNALARQSNLRVMAEAMSAVWGEGCRFKLLASKAQPAPKQKTPPPAPEVINNPRVQAVLDIFGGAVQAVEEQDSGEQG